MNDLPFNREPRDEFRPLPESDEPSNKVVAEDLATKHPNTAFATLINGILERTALPEGERRQRLAKYFLNNLADATLSLATIAGVRRFIRDLDQTQLQELAVSLSTDEMSELLHLLYVSVSAEMGPVAADRIFSEAMDETEKLYQASQFPARSLF